MTDWRACSLAGGVVFAGEERFCAMMQRLTLGGEELVTPPICTECPLPALVKALERAEYWLWQALRATGARGHSPDAVYEGMSGARLRARASLDALKELTPAVPGRDDESREEDGQTT